MPKSFTHPLLGKHDLAHLTALTRQLGPEAAFDELLPWVESLAGDVDMPFDDKAALLFALDESLQGPAYRCADLYLESCGGENLEGSRRLRTKQCQAWGRIFDVYGELLITLAAGMGRGERSELVAAISVRAIRAASQLIKWQAFRGESANHEIWARLNLAYRLAEHAGVARLSVQPRQDREAVLTVEREYTRALALHSLEPEQLDAVSLELASRVVNYVLARLELSPVPVTTSLYWIDAAQAMLPVRLVQLPDQVGMPRFFAGALAVDSLQSMLELASVGNVPPGFSVQHMTGSGYFANVLAHMVRHWSGIAPLRRQRRHAMPGAMRVVLGVEAVFARICQQGQEAPGEEWECTVHDVSRRGIGIDMPAETARRTAVGMLVGMCLTDADCWRTGIVRRVRQGSSGTSQVGVELFAEIASSVIVRDGATQMQALLLDPLKPGSTVRLIFSSMAASSSPVLFLGEGGQTYRLSLLPGREYGADHEICTCLLSLA